LVISGETDKSVDYFLNASYNLEKDSLLIKFLDLDKLNETNHTIKQIEEPIVAAKSYGRRSILLGRDESFMSGVSQCKKPNLTTETIYENQLLLNYYTKIVHYYDLTQSPKAIIKLTQTALLKSSFSNLIRVNNYYFSLAIIFLIIKEKIIIKTII
jgi:hypothetical protein